MDIKAILNEAADAVSHIEGTHLEYRLRAAAEALGEPVGLYDRDGGRVRWYKTPEHGSPLYVAPPAPAVPEGWKVERFGFGEFRRFVITSPEGGKDDAWADAGKCPDDNRDDLLERFVYAMLSTAPEPGTETDQ